ncbi:MAG TPA: CoA transferase [Solirubrobacterales bacterium]|nr:CoA transferase [Solirubrobacterales bacterium]
MAAEERGRALVAAARAWAEGALARAGLAAPLDAVAIDGAGLAEAVAELTRRDGREGAEAVWAAAAVAALGGRMALLAASGGGAVGAGAVLEETFLGPLDVLDDARAGVAIAATADGTLALQAPTPLHRELLAGLFGVAEPGDWRDAVPGWAGRRGTEEAVELLQDLGLPAFAVASAPRATTRDAPAPSPPGRLDDVLAIELGGLWAAPYATKLLAERGARALKVEAPSRPDGTRRGPAGWFATLNEGKELISLDLRRDADRARLLARLGPRTVVIENNTDRVLGNLGLPPAVFAARGAALVRLPASRLAPARRGLGTTIELAAGLGRPGPDGRLAPAPIPLTDPLAGAAAALAALGALAGGPRLRVVGQLEDVAVPLALAARAAERTGVGAR